MFSHLLALRNGSSESLDAGHVRSPLAAIGVHAFSEAVGADVKVRQRPHGGDSIGNIHGAIHFH